MDWMTKPNLLAVHEARRLMAEGSLSASELIQACYRQIESLNARLNAFITVIPPANQLASVPSEGGEEAAGSLAGIPVAVKDLFDTQNVRTTAGSFFFRGNIPSADSHVVASLKEQGAYIIGKTNTHEIALGVTTANPHFGACLNPWDPTRIPGGSSGGSAVAVATGMALAAVGTDTGGSIRIPAALCGVVGLKPTYGRVSLRGVTPLSWNLDHAGPLTRTVRDATLMLQVIAGYDPEDPYCSSQPIDDYTRGLEDGIRGWRVALAKGNYAENSEAEVAQAVQSAAEALGQIGADVTLVDVSYLHDAAKANGQITQADGSAFHRDRLAEHPEWFGEDVRRRLEAGRDLGSSDYVLARHTQAETMHRLNRLFDEHRILVLPTTPICAPTAGQDAVEQSRTLTRFTAPLAILAAVP